MQTAFVQAVVNQAPPEDKPTVAVMSTMFYRELDQHRAGDLRAVYCAQRHFSCRSDMMDSIYDVEVLLLPIHVPYGSAQRGHFVRHLTRHMPSDASAR